MFPTVALYQGLPERVGTPSLSNWREIACREKPPACSSLIRAIAARSMWVCPNGVGPDFDSVDIMRNPNEKAQPLLGAGLREYCCGALPRGSLQDLAHHGITPGLTCASRYTFGVQFGGNAPPTDSRRFQRRHAFDDDGFTLTVPEGLPAFTAACSGPLPDTCAAQL